MQQMKKLPDGASCGESGFHLAALTSIDLGLYEAANIDGANRFKQILHITIPCLLPKDFTLSAYEKLLKDS